MGWQFTPLLEPGPRAKRAALADVLRPWTTPVTRVFRGRFLPGASRTQGFAFRLRLDGALTIRLNGPRGTNFDIAVTSLGRDAGKTSGPRSDDRYRVAYACREVDAETVLVKILRRKGFGRFAATVTYAG